MTESFTSQARSERSEVTESSVWRSASWGGCGWCVFSRDAFTAGECALCRWTNTSPFSHILCCANILTTVTGMIGTSWRWKTSTTPSTCRAWIRLPAVSPSIRAYRGTSACSLSASPVLTRWQPSTTASCPNTWPPTTFWCVFSYLLLRPFAALVAVFVR